MVKQKLLKKDFDLFVKEVKKWQDILGMKDWEICCVFGDTDENNRAEFMTNHVSRIVTIWLNNVWDKEDISKEAIRKVAFHEMVEILLQDLKNLALRDSNPHVVDSEGHKVVKVLENVLFPKY